MKSKALIAAIGFVAGVASSSVAVQFIRIAYAAPMPILLSNPQEVIARCDFTKTIAIIGGIACLPR